MARVAILTAVMDEAGNRLGGSPVEVRVFDDFACTTPTVVTDDAAGGTTIAQPITPNAGAFTTLTVTTGAGDTTITVASTIGFAVGQYIPVFDSTTTKYFFIRSILSGPPRLTLERAVGTVFSNTNTSVGNPDQIGLVAGYVPDTTFHYIQCKDVASGRIMPPTFLPTSIGISSVAVLEEGAAAGTRTQINFIGARVTAVDNGGANRVDVTIPNPMTTLGDVIIGGASGAETRLGIGATGQVLSVVSGSPAWTYPLHTTVEALLGSDVALNGVVGTWVDIISVSLVAGTWILFGTASLYANLQVQGAVFRLSDGTTHKSSAEYYPSSASNSMNEVPLMAILVLASTTTWKMQATPETQSGSAVVKAATFDAGSGNTATHLIALRIA
jgi:hypothetical protein